MQGDKLMRLVVKHNGRTVNEFQFAKGPVHIGRHADSQIFLPDRIVSRHHAVIFNTQDSKWMVEDLDSSNKTYLNDKAIHKAEIKAGDCLRIADFTIEIDLAGNSIANNAINLEDTLSKTAYGFEKTSTTTANKPQIIVRIPDGRHAADIKLPAERAKAFVEATETICKADGLDDTLGALLRIAAKQFNAYRTWCALRNQPTGPMLCHTGRKRDNQTILLNEIKLKEKITETVEKGQFLLFPRIPAQEKETEKIRSAMIAPILGLRGCFGVLYIDNAMDHEHYTHSDLDYLMLIAIHTAAILENF